MRTDPSKAIPLSGEPSENWIAFHKALKSWFNKQTANAYFLKFWNQRGGAGSAADTHSLREYMETQDVDLTTTWKGDVVDTTIGIYEWIGDAGKMVGIIILTVAAIAVGLVVYIVVKGTNRITAPKAQQTQPISLIATGPGLAKGINTVERLP